MTGESTHKTEESKQEKKRETRGVGRGVGKILPDSNPRTYWGQDGGCACEGAGDQTLNFLTEIQPLPEKFRKEKVHTV